MNKYDELQSLTESLKSDFEKFYDKNNGAAGTRVRKGMQALAAFAKNVRKEVTEIKNSRPV